MGVFASRQRLSNASKRSAKTQKGVALPAAQRPFRQDILSRCIMTECPLVEHSASPLSPVFHRTFASPLMRSLFLLSGIHHAKTRDSWRELFITV
jgi:hypothetical protein